MAPSLPRCAAAEGFAVFALVFAGCGAIVSDAVSDGALGTVELGAFAYQLVRVESLIG